MSRFKHSPSPPRLANEVFFTGPPVILVEVTTAWYYYTGGVLTATVAGCSGGSSDVNHAVQLVG